MIGIYIPTFGRPDKLQALADNIKATTRSDYELYWGVEPFDTASIEAGKKTGHPVILNTDEPNYGNALQSIYEATEEPIFFPANDDFLFLDGWDTAPLAMFEKFPDIGVLGVHDGNPKTSFTSVYMVRRSYIQEHSGVIDMPNRVLYPYGHNFSDNELAGTAQKRGMWDRCTEPCIQHQHPSFTWLGEFPT